MHTRLLAGLFVVFACCTFSAPAFADEQEPNEDQQSRQHRAKALWDEGTRRYDLGKFDEAADLFLKAYEIWPFQAILFNLCQAHRQKSDYRKAIFFCKAFLRNQPDATNRSDVEDLILEMEKTLDTQAATNEKPPEGVVRPVPGGGYGGEGERTTRPYRPWKWITLAASGAAVATGVTLILIHQDQFGQDGMRAEFPRDTMTSGIAATAGGAALLATSALLWILDGKSGGSRSTKIAVVPGGSGFYLSLAGAF